MNAVVNRLFACGLFVGKLLTHHIQFVRVPLEVMSSDHFFLALFNNGQRIPKATLTVTMVNFTLDFQLHYTGQ